MTMLGLSLLDHGLQQFGYGQRLGVHVASDQDAAIRADGERGAEGLLRLLHADGDDHDLGGHALLAQAHGLFDGDLVEGVHGHLHVGEIDAGLVGFHPNLHVVVDHPLDRDQDLHRRFVLSVGRGWCAANRKRRAV